MELGANIYLRADTAYVRSLIKDEPMPAVVLLVYGPTYGQTVSRLSSSHLLLRSKVTLDLPGAATHRRAH